MVNPIVAWRGFSELRATALDRMRRLAGTGSLVQGGRVQVGDPNGFQAGFHVCLNAEQVAAERNISVGELLSDNGSGVSWLDESERLWGIPRTVGGLLDRCFERVPAEEAGGFAVVALEAIPVGVDLMPVPARWILDLLADDSGGGTNGVTRYTATGSPQRAAVEQVVTLFRRMLAGDVPDEAEWKEAALAAESASALAHAADPAGPAACATATAHAASAAYAPDATPSTLRMAAMRASLAIADETEATAYQAAYLATEAFAKAAEYAAEAVKAAADATFQVVVAPILTAAERARAAEQVRQPVSPEDAAAVARVRQAAEAAAATCVQHYRWRAGRLVQHLAETR
jgi:hypothetical protein